MIHTPVSKILIPFLVFSGFLMLCSCEKEAVTLQGEVGLYLLKSYGTPDTSGAIDSADAVPENEPLITYAEFSSYDPETHVFKLAESARNTIEELEFPVQGIPFAVMANGILIYTGYFWPAYSSLSCQWIVVDPDHASLSGEMRVELGYPYHFDGVRIPDQRNHLLILGIFRRDGKLVE